jgi:hypothetical protein
VLHQRHQSGQQGGSARSIPLVGEPYQHVVERAQQPIWGRSRLLNAVNNAGTTQPTALLDLGGPAVDPSVTDTAAWDVEVRVDVLRVDGAARRRWRALAGALRSDGRGRRTPADLVEELVEVVDAPSGGEVEQLDDDLCTRRGNRYGEGGHGQALGKRRHRREAALGKRAVASGTTEARRGEGRGCSTPLASCPSLRLPSARGYGRERNQGAMMNPFFRTPPPSDEEEKKVARAIAWVALALWAIIGLLAMVLPP